MAKQILQKEYKALSQEEWVQIEVRPKRGTSHSLYL